MRVLLITATYPTPRAPTRGAFNAALCDGLRSAGDEVRVIAPVPWLDLRNPVVRPHVDPWVAHPVWLYPPRLAHANRHRWMRRAVIAACQRITTNWQPDLVLGYWTHPDGTVAMEVAARFGIPGVLLVGGSDILLLTREPKRRQIIMETLRSADRVLTIGPALREAVIALGVPADRVEAFARGIDRKVFAPGDGAAARQRLGLPTTRPIVLWVGRMVPVKGLDVLLEAWETIGALDSSPLLVLVGDGPERSRLEAMVSGGSSQVRFVGPVEHGALAEWYRAADLVVLPSLSEGVPNVLLEAIACGTPFVASDVGGIRGLSADHSTVVPAGDARLLANALRGALPATALARRVDPNGVLDQAASTDHLRQVLSRVARHHGGVR